MIEYYLKAIEMGDCHESSLDAINELAFYYETIDDIDNMIKYYQLAIHKGKLYDTARDGSLYAMNQLGLYFRFIYDFDNMITYFMMAINQGDIDGMINMADSYYIIKDYDTAIHYYMIAVNKNSAFAIHYVTNCYFYLNNYEQMEKYYMMAYNNGYDPSIKKLISWHEIQKNMNQEIIFKYTNLQILASN